jgi:iron-sulfur cluster insertion protein
METLELDQPAAEALDQHLSGSKNDCLRLAVEGGGCSGFQYKLQLDQPREEDQVFASRGHRIICDPVSLSFVAGSTISYQEGLQGAGFVVNNPNITGSCGCGMSFYND